MLKVLWMTYNRTNLVCQEFYTNLERAVGKYADCKWAGQNHPLYKKESVDETVKRLYGSDSPDWVLFMPFTWLEQRRWVNQKFCDKKDRSYKVGAWVGDCHTSHVLHSRAKGFIDAINNANYDACFMLYLTPIWKRLLQMPLFHVPVCVDPEEFKPLPKEADVASLGVANPSIHPIRYAVNQELPELAEQHKWKIFMSGRPGGQGGNRDIDELLKMGWIVGKRYAEVLGKTKVFIFDSSIYKYPLLKYFEGMSSECCVLADVPSTADELHLFSPYNFVEIDKNNWKEKLLYYLKHDDERVEIAKYGRETVLSYHTYDIRGRRWVEMLEANK